MALTKALSDWKRVEARQYRRELNREARREVEEFSTTNVRPCLECKRLIESDGRPDLCEGCWNNLGYCDFLSLNFPVPGIYE